MTTEKIVRCDIHGETVPEDENGFDRLSVYLGHRPLLEIDYCGETDRHELIRAVSTRLHDHADQLVENVADGFDLDGSDDVVAVEPGTQRIV